MNKLKLFLILAPVVVFTQKSEDQEMALKVHNDARNDVGVAPLVWSEKLEKEALDYAKILAKTNNYKHSSTKDGENLDMSYKYMETNGNRTYIYSKTPLYDSSLAWYNEIKDYKYSKIRRNRIGPKIGHYTQMIWKDTRQVGIASAISKNGRVYVVARYFPVGNYVGEYPY